MADPRVAIVFWEGPVQTDWSMEEEVRWEAGKQGRVDSQESEIKTIV